MPTIQDNLVDIIRLARGATLAIEELADRSGTNVSSAADVARTMRGIGFANAKLDAVLNNQAVESQRSITTQGFLRDLGASVSETNRILYGKPGDGGARGRLEGLF